MLLLLLAPPRCIVILLKETGLQSLFEMFGDERPAVVSIRRRLVRVGVKS